MSAPVTSQTVSQDWLVNDRQVVSAVQWLNKTEWLGQDRELTYTRDTKTGKLVIQILERQTGEVVDQIPPESVLRLVSDLQAELKAKDE
jgi:uncharacterized FlaG/YvyC family protein